MKTFYSVLVFSTFSLFLPFLTNAQINLDSLKEVVSTSTNDSLKMHGYFLLAKNTGKENPELAKQYSMKSYDLALSLGDKEGIGNAFSHLGYANYVQGNLDSAMYWWDTTANIFEDVGAVVKAASMWENIAQHHMFKGNYNLSLNVLNKARKIYVEADTNLQEFILINFGLHYDLKGDYDSAYYYYHQAFVLAEEVNDNYRMGLVNNNMSAMNYYMGDCRKAISYGNKALQNWQDKEYNFRKIGAYTNMGLCYEKLGIIDSAILVNELALEINEAIGNRWAQARIYHNIGALYLDLENYIKAEFNLLEARKIKETFEPRESSSTTYVELAKLYTKIGNGTNIEFYIKRGIDLAKQVNMLEEIKSATEFASKYYEEQGDYKKSLVYYKEFEQVSDSLINKETISNIKEIEERYQNEKILLENKLLSSINIGSRQKIKSRNLIIGISFLAFSFLGFLTFYIIKQSKKRKELNKSLVVKNKEISLLNREVLHRTKNQFALAGNILESQDYGEIEFAGKKYLHDSAYKLRAISSINKRLNLDSNQTKINLHEVISEVVQDVLFSFGQTNNIQIKGIFGLPEVQLDSNKTSYIALIINELVLNSIKHAFNYSADPTISIKGALQGDNLQISYCDNGGGSPSENQGGGSQLIEDFLCQLNAVEINRTFEKGFSLNFKIPML